MDGGGGRPVSGQQHCILLCNHLRNFTSFLSSRAYAQPSSNGKVIKEMSSYRAIHPCCNLTGQQEGNMYTNESNVKINLVNPDTWMASWSHLLQMYVRSTLELLVWEGDLNIYQMHAHCPGCAYLLRTYWRCAYLQCWRNGGCEADRKVS